MSPWCELTVLILYTELLKRKTVGGELLLKKTHTFYLRCCCETCSTTTGDLKCGSDLEVIERIAD